MHALHAMHTLHAMHGIRHCLVIARAQNVRGTFTRHRVRKSGNLFWALQETSLQTATAPSAQHPPSMPPSRHCGGGTSIRRPAPLIGHFEFKTREVNMFSFLVCVRGRYLLPTVWFMAGLSRTIPAVAMRMMLINEMKVEPEQQAILGVWLL